jgi:CBS domain-containing protein
MTRTVADVMTRTVVVVAGSAPFKEVVRAMREYRVSALPVTDPDGLVMGVVSEADLMLREDPSVLESHFFEGHARREERRKAEASIARDLMTTPAVTIGPQAPIAEAARLMHERAIKRLPVIDLEGRIVGVVSRVDLLAEFLRDDGDIETEVIRVLRRRSRDHAGSDPVVRRRWGGAPGGPGRDAIPGTDDLASRARRAGCRGPR